MTRIQTEIRLPEDKVEDADWMPTQARSQKGLLQRIMDFFGGRYLRDKAAGRNDALERETLEAEVSLKKSKAQIAELEVQELQGWPV